METTSYHLICEIEARSGALDVIFRYDADLFDDDLAGMMLDECTEFLASCSTDRQQQELGR